MARTKPRLTIIQVMMWADAHHQRTGKWPSVRSGTIRGAPRETWARLNAALENGHRGFRGGTSLAKLLKKHRGETGGDNRPKLTRKLILQWADAHHQRTGKWPYVQSGTIQECPEENWKRVDNALRWGLRGFPGQSSLAQFLTERRGAWNRKDRPVLTYKAILQWCDEHHRRTGEWPHLCEDRIHGTRYETWTGVNAALWQGTRGMPGGESLARLLAKRRNKRYRLATPRLTIKQILKWADAYVARTGRRPDCKSGPIPSTNGETWCSVSKALERGKRGFPGGSTLPRLLDKHPRFRRGKR